MLRFGAALLLLAAVVAAQNPVNRTAVQTYLEEVYSSTPSSQWSALSDNEIFTLYGNLTFYFPGAPDQSQLSTYNNAYPNGRAQSYMYAGDMCSCLHIQLDGCVTFTPTATCPYWPVKTYMNFNYVQTLTEGFPANTWFEGLSFPGEWAFPLSCNNQNLGQYVYGFNNHIWLYPITGFGVWWNTGSTSWGYNKVDWIIKNGVGQTANGLYLGSTPTEVFVTLANVACPGFQNRTNTQCDSCPYSQTGSTTKCCCHGPGYNLGTQILQTQQYNSLTLNQAITTVMGYYQQGLYGQDGQQSYYYPQGTYFAYRDLLDPYFMALQVNLNLKTAQFIREPQHSGGSGTPSSPAYAFEFLVQDQNWQYDWGQFCGSDELAVLNPLNHIDTYTSNGYIANPSNPQPVSSWNPTPSYLALFNVDTAAYLADGSRADVGAAASSGNNAALVAAIVVPIVVAAVIAAVAAVILNRRSRHMPLTDRQMGEMKL